MNKMNLVGKLMNVDFGEGKLSDGREYKRATVTIRVTQSVDGKEETSEIPVGFFASPYTSTGKPNPAYKSLVDLKELKTAQNVGVDNADQVRITSATLSENNFVSLKEAGAKLVLEGVTTAYEVMRITNESD